jgi:hypothetical protein
MLLTYKMRAYITVISFFTVISIFTVVSLVDCIAKAMDVGAASPFMSSPFDHHLWGHFDHQVIKFNTEADFPTN